jgi:hypothetical protein
LFWLGLEKNPSLELIYTFAYRFFMVHSGHLVWMGLLFLYRLALGCKEKMGLHDQSTSYVHFLLLKLTGINFQKDLVDKVTLIVFFVSLALSIWLNILDYKKRRLIKNRPDLSGRQIS